MRLKTPKRKKPLPNTYAFIDSQNLNLGTQRMGWKVDWRKFRKFLADKYGVTKAYMFIGYMSENEALYEYMHELGFLVVLKPTVDVTAAVVPNEEGIENTAKKTHEDKEKPVVKGNVDAELVLYAMKEMPNYERAIIVSGDGDFFSLAEYLDEQGKLAHILTPNWQYSSLLKVFESKIVRLDQLRRQLAYHDRKKKMTAQDLKEELRHYGNDADALFLQRFFKTGPGQYGEGDVFMGVRVPQTRRVAAKFRSLPTAEIQKLLDSPVHEHRLAGLIIMTLQFARADEAGQKQIYTLYIKNTLKGRINNWDLVDVSADKVVGAYLMDRPRDILDELARSNDLWQKRVAVLSTFWLIKKGDPSTTLDIAEILLHDPHDLIQKAVGWMLREVGKRVDRAILTDFLDRHAHEMPRTMLRYSLEHLPPELKAHYMRQKLQT